MNNDNLLSPEAPRFARCDSLVFSITAEKDDSPHDTDLLKDSYQAEQCRQINELNSKLGALEYKVKSIKTQQADPQSRPLGHNQNIDVSNLTLGEDGFKAGRFHRKPLVNPLNKTSNNTSFTATVRNNRSESHGSRASNHSHNSQLALRDGQLRSMRKQMLKLRMRVEKSQRSKSKCSERLSESKQSIKVLEGQKKSGERMIANLVKDLKKSENIRKKQKQTIAKQKKQIEELKKLLTVLKTGLRI